MDAKLNGFTVIGMSIYALMVKRNFQYSLKKKNLHI
jgi:hypothetical protein